MAMTRGTMRGEKLPLINTSLRGPTRIEFVLYLRCLLRCGSWFESVGLESKHGCRGTRQKV